MLGRLAIKILSLYQKYVRIIMPFSCRFFPSCSEYTKQAIKKYGFWQGIFKGGKRIFSCHPFSRKNGYDPLM